MNAHVDISQKLLDKGYRLTPQRSLVVAALEKSHDHISAEEIYSQVLNVYPHVNISTVYRTLELLKGLGMVTETELGGGRVRYHPADRGHHHHLICQVCGAILILDEASFSELSEVIFKRYGFKADLKHLAIFGRCSQCIGK